MILYSDTPTQTHLSVNPWVIHRSPALFGTDADVFNPNRWLESRGREMEKYMMQVRFNVIPFSTSLSTSPIFSRCPLSSLTYTLKQFGAGYNSCPGRNLANLEISKVTATMIRDYDIRQVEPGKEWRYEAHFTAVPYEWPCYVKRRDREGESGKVE